MPLPRRAVTLIHRPAARPILQKVVLTACMAIGSLTWHAAIQAQDKEASKKLAQEVPIADVHMHLYPELTPDELRARMDRNKVVWGGAVGPVRPGADPEPYIRALGKRYVPAGAQSDYARIYMSGGVKEMESADSPAFVALKARLEQDFEQKRIQGIGELILNNLNSHPIPSFRRKARVDAPPFEALFELASKYNGFVQVHMEDDSDSVASLEALLARHPKVPVILSHCMARASAKSAGALLARHANLYCETSARSAAILQHPNAYQYRIHDAGWADPDWLALIEAMPDRFMVGSDVTSPMLQYDGIIQQVRSGLLANLSETTMKKVAYENAQRVLRLEAIDP